MNTLATDKPRVSVTLDVDIYEWLEKVAIESDQPKSHVIVQAIKKLRETPPNTIELDLPEEIVKKLQGKAAASYRNPIDEAKYAIAKHVEDQQ